jgi:MOB kinase activator 1
LHAVAHVLVYLVVDFYNQINLLYGSITEFCSPQTCPEMKATDEFEYLWQDSENFKRPTKMSAPEYIEHLMAWVQSNVDNEQMFPSRIGMLQGKNGRFCVPLLTTLSI